MIKNAVLAALLLMGLAACSFWYWAPNIATTAVELAHEGVTVITDEDGRVITAWPSAVDSNGINDVTSVDFSVFREAGFGPGNRSWIIDEDSEED